MNKPQTKILRAPPQQGSSLIIVMIVLVIVSVLGLGAAQISMMSERGSRNDRDRQVAWQSADAGLIDAAADICGNQCGGPVASTRQDVFKSNRAIDFINNCGTAGNQRGLCLLSDSAKPTWLRVNFDDDTNSAPTTKVGTFTGASFASGSVGLQPFKSPRYIMEILDDKPIGGNASKPGKYVYRVTSMGYGPRQDIQAVVQMLFRK